MKPRAKSALLVALGLARTGRTDLSTSEKRCQWRKLAKAAKPACGEIFWSVKPILMDLPSVSTVKRSVTDWGTDTSACFDVFFHYFQAQPQQWHLRNCIIRAKGGTPNGKQVWSPAFRRSDR